MMLYPDEHGVPPHTGTDELLGAQFSTDELVQLSLLRKRFHAYPDRRDADPTLRRLEFARWLMQHGKLTED